MELLFENVRNTIFGKLLKLPRGVSKAISYDFVRIAIIISSSFLLGRVALFYAIFPCGIALITVFMDKSRANIYTLPLIVGGLLTNYGTGYDFWGDALAVLFCAVIFFLIGKLRMSIVVKAFTAAGIMVLTKSIY